MQAKVPAPDADTLESDADTLQSAPGAGLRQVQGHGGTCYCCSRQHERRARYVLVAGDGGRIIPYLALH